MKIVIIEDEPLAAKDLQKLLQRLDTSMEVLTVLPGLAAAKSWFAQNREPDLLFMDIQLSDGVSFDLFKYVKIECPIIFTTAYNEYAIRAFKVNSIDYLLKPIDQQELQTALDKFRKYKAHQQPADLQQQIKALIQDLHISDTAKKYKERFMAHFKNTLVPVYIDQIAYFAKDELIYIMTIGGQKLICDYNTLEEVEQLVNPQLFFRANRQYIIHLNSIDNIKHGFNGKLLVKLKSPVNVEIDISREKAAIFKSWIN